MSRQGTFITLPHFSGTLSELAAALRLEKLLPSEVPLLQLTREVLGRAAAHQLTFDEYETALPILANVIALKAQLLLPKPEVMVIEDEWDELEEVLDSVEALAELDSLVSFLAQRRLERSGLIAARALDLQLPRKIRPAAGSAGLAKLVKAAQGAVRQVQVPLLARERLTLAGALRALSVFGARLQTFTFLSVPVADWGERTTYFSALLEGVKDGTFSVEQPQAFADIEVRHLAQEP